MRLYNPELKISHIVFSHNVSSTDWLFLLSHPEGHETTSSDLDSLESNSWKITNGMTRSTETGNKDLVVFVNKGHTTILWHVSGDSLVVLLKLDSDTLSNSGVRLLGFDGNLFNNDACCVGSFGEWLLPL